MPKRFKYANLKFQVIALEVNLKNLTTSQFVLHILQFILIFRFQNFTFL